MKKLFLFFFTVHCSLFTVHCFSQDQHLIDSLQAVLGTAKPDTNSANILYKISKAYWSNDPVKAMDYARQALSVSEKIGFKKGMGNAYNIMGVIRYGNGEYKQAMEFHEKALKIRQENGDKKGIAASYVNIGLIYSNQGNYPEALKYYFASLKIMEETGEKKEIAVNYNNIGQLYSEQGNYPAALKYYLASLKIKQELGFKDGIAYSYGNIGNIYSKQDNNPAALKYYFASLKIFEEIGNKKGIALNYNNIGQIYSKQGNYPAALKYCLASLKIKEEFGLKDGIVNSYSNIGNIYSGQGNYPAALKYYFASLKISEEIGNKKGIAYSYLNIGTIYVKQKKYNDAAQYLKKSLSLSKESGHLEDMVHCYMNLAIVDSARGDFRNALEHYQLYLKARDSLKREETAKKLQQMEFQKQLLADSLKQEEEKLRVEMAHKEQMHRQRNQKIILFSAIAVVLIISFGIWRRLRYTRKAKAEIENAKRIIEIEKERSENLLLNILPSEVAEEIKQDGHSKARTFSMVTVMFTDFKDFTAVSEKYSAELLVAEIDHCFSAFDNIIHKYGIEKIKTVGDAYMCVGGMPVLTTTHAVDVVNAAIEIRDFMVTRKKEQDAKGGISFELRLGIHTGPVVAGIVGVKKFQYDIWGDTVNLTARMEQNSEAGKINISGSTYKLVKDKFTCTYRGKIEVKNKGEVEMYFVEAVLHI